MADDGLISVIIPVFNCERYVKQSIQSVLDQDYDQIELVVVDDGSTDASAHVVRSFEPHLILVSRPNGGISAARNTGVEASHGDLIAFLDADDLWSLNKLSLQMEALRADPDLGMVFTLVRQFVSLDLDEKTKSSIKCDPEIAIAPTASSMLVTREAFGKVGPFDAQWRVGEFMDWYAKAMEVGIKGHMIRDALTQRRLHSTNTVTRLRESWADYLRILKKAMDRRRESAPEDSREA